MTEYNNPSGELPFALVYPSHEMRLMWVCGYDEDGKVTEVFDYSEKDKKDKLVRYLKDKSEATSHKKELMDCGWIEARPIQSNIIISEDK